MARPWLNARIIIEVLQVDSRSLFKGHPGGDFAASVAHALAVFFEGLGQLRLGYAEMSCFERLPNLFAAYENSGIIPARFMADEILDARSFPRFGRFLAFHKLDRRTIP